jgi:sugar phosphate isomerase/epimerase
LKFSLSTGTFYIYPLSVVFRWARQAGFDGVELGTNPEAILRGGQAVRDLAQRWDLEIFSLHPTLIPLPGWSERHGGLDRTISLAQRAGAHMVVMHTPRSESLDSGDGLIFRQKIAEWQARLARTHPGPGSGQGRLRLAVENKSIRTEADHAWALTPLNRLRAFADRHDLDLVLDTTHAGTAGEDLLQAYHTFNDRLANVHLSDMDASALQVPSPYGHRVLGQHMLPGQGTLPLIDLMAGLSAGGYAGPVTLEVHPIALRIWWPPAVRRHLRWVMAWMKAATSGKADPTP